MQFPFFLIIFWHKLIPVESKEYDGSTFTCTVEHEALIGNLLSEDYTVDIKYVPDKPKIIPHNPDCEADVTNILELVCMGDETYPGNPRWIISLNSFWGHKNWD